MEKLDTKTSTSLFVWTKGCLASFLAGTMKVNSLYIFGSVIPRTTRRSKEPYTAKIHFENDPFICKLKSLLEFKLFLQITPVTSWTYLWKLIREVVVGMKFVTGIYK